MKSLLIAATSLIAAGAAQAGASTYSVDPTHTNAVFEISHFATSTNRGRFDKKEGTVTLDKAAKTGTVEITIDTASINTGVAPFNKELAGPSFFRSNEFPTAKFVGDKFTFNGDKVTEVAGTLTMLGKTNPVVLKAANFNCYMSPIFKREVCGGDFDATITRSQWGLSYGLEYGFPDQVRLVIQVEAIKQ